jgi:wyosine [tRNA(Phe)-imidazoG37] synthetase (radical SAM superfamily)
LWDPEVRKDLLLADRVVPSLDAITPEVFREINRPHPSLEISRIAEGIRAFRLEYRGQLQVEIVLASGVNDNPEELAALARAVDRIKPNKVELNTVVRPPALSGTRGLSNEQMQRAAGCFPRGMTEIVGVFNAAGRESGTERLEERILETIERRPCTISELAVSLGVSESTVELEARKLGGQKKLAKLCFEDKEFLCKP